MTAPFDKAERSCFNMTHYAKMIPECHAIFVMPPGCSRILRLSAIEEGISDRFTMFNLEQADIINGDVEQIFIDGATNILDMLTEEGRRPKVFAVYASCVDGFIGTDREYIMAQLKEYAPDIEFLELAIDPINKDTLPPLVRLHNALTALFEKTGSERAANWLGSNLPPDENGELYQKLMQQGLAPKHLSRCKTLAELREMGNSTVNIVAAPPALAAAKKLKARFGIPYYNMANPNDAESLKESELLAL